MRKLLSTEYIPFGSQYYRAPSPHRSDWPDDLAAMHRMGFNTVKFWVQWRWNQPEENRYDFNDIDELMDLAHRNHLRVMLNTIFDVAPAWIYKNYPDASMITLNGVRVGPQTQPHRQIGGLGYCFNHDGVMVHFFDFLKTVVERYRDHPALEIWNVGSEPELTSSMAEMRLWADNHERMGDMLCFCDNCRSKFRYWLEDKYGSVDKLNSAWNRNYVSFDEAEIPRTRNTFNDMIDWRMFFVYTLGQNVKRRFEIARDADQGRHALMCHHVFVQGFPVTSTANDPWNIGRYGDLQGFTQMDDAMMTDVLRSCARDKPVISAEMLMLPGYTLDMPHLVDANDVKRYIFTGLAGNLKGFIFWQYRPEILGREAPTWGLTRLDGASTPWLNAFAETGRVLQRNRAFILDAEPLKANVAMLYNPENQIFAWISTGNEKNATDALLGTHRALYEHNYIIDLIHPRDFECGRLDPYKVLYIPFPYVLNKDLTDKIRAWVKAGGVLISEAYFGGWNMEHGHHEKTVPGYGFHEVFRIRQEAAESLGNELEGIIKTLVDLPYLTKGSRVQGGIIRERLTCEGAEVLAEFDDGQPAVTAADYGSGKAIHVGSYIGLPFHRSKIYENGELIASLVEWAVRIQRPEPSVNQKVRLDWLGSGDGRVMLIVQNLINEEQNCTMVIPAGKPYRLNEQFSAEQLELRADADGQRIHGSLHLMPKEVKVFCA